LAKEGKEEGVDSKFSEKLEALFGGVMEEGYCTHALRQHL